MATVTLTTGVSVPLLGTISIAAALVDDTATRIQLQFDITNHTATSTTSLDALCEISFDAGLTWNHLCSCGRDKGYNDSTPLCFVATSLPSGTARMIRGSLTSVSSITTSLQIVLS